MVQCIANRSCLEARWKFVPECGQTLVVVCSPVLAYEPTICIFFWFQMVMYKQAGQRLPNEFVQQHQDIVRLIQWQKSQLQHGGPAVRKGNLTERSSHED